MFMHSSERLLLIAISFMSCYLAYLALPEVQKKLNCSIHHSLSSVPSGSISLQKTVVQMDALARVLPGVSPTGCFDFVQYSKIDSE